VVEPVETTTPRRGVLTNLCDEGRFHPVTSILLPDNVLVEAALAVAEVFGLGDQAEVGKSWLVDEGDTVVVAELAGDATGQLMLAVNDDVATRLTSDPARLAGGLARAVEVFSAALGIELALGEVTAAAAMSLDEPRHRVEIRDSAKLCALLGCTVAGVLTDEGDNDEELPPGAVTAEPFAPVQFGEHGAAPAGTAALAGLGPLALLQDIDMEITVELGRTTMQIRDLLALQPGMVVEIDRVAGAPIDVLVNGHRFACGEVVVIDEEFGLRITEIVGAS